MECYEFTKEKLGLFCCPGSLWRGQDCLPLSPTVQSTSLLRQHTALNILYSAVTSKMQSTLTPSTIPASRKRKCSPSSRVHARPSKQCTIITPWYPSIRRPQTHPARVRTTLRNPRHRRSDQRHSAHSRQNSKTAIPTPQTLQTMTKRNQKTTTPSPSPREMRTVVSPTEAPSHSSHQRTKKVEEKERANQP